MHIEQLESRQYFNFLYYYSLASFVSTNLPRELVAGSRIHANVVVQWGGDGIKGVRDRYGGEVDLYATATGTAFNYSQPIIRSKVQKLNIGIRAHNWVIPISKIPASIPAGSYTLVVASTNNGAHGVDMSTFSFTVIQPAPAPNSPW